MGTSKILPSRASGNPAVLFNIPFGLVLAMQGNYFFGWSPAFVGMTTYADDARRFPPLDSRLIKRLAIRLMKRLAIPLSNQKTVAKWLVIGWQNALHSHLAKSPKYGDISRWLTPAKSLVMCGNDAVEFVEVS